MVFFAMKHGGSQFLSLMIVSTHSGSEDSVAHFFKRLFSQRKKTKSHNEKCFLCPFVSLSLSSLTLAVSQCPLSCPVCPLFIGQLKRSPVRIFGPLCLFDSLPSSPSVQCCPLKMCNQHDGRQSCLHVELTVLTIFMSLLSTHQLWCLC